jgi:alpha,alpha-trehalose phosphorylase
VTAAERAPYPVEPWVVREPELDLERLAITESVFALSNGHIGLRGNLDEGDPHGLPGSYLSSYYESRPLPYAEGAYGNPEDGQTVVNVTNGKLFRVLVDDEPFDVRYGELERHERVLDLRAGTLHREVEWVTPAGQRVRIRTTRLVSFTHRSIVAIRHEVEAVDSPLRVIVQSELVANEAVPTSEDDPRVAAAMESPLESEEHFGDTTRAHLVHITKGSRQRMASAMDHHVHGPDGTEVSTEAHADWARTTVGCRLEAGESLVITKYVSYGWSSQRTVPALRDQVAAALTSAAQEGWDSMHAAQRAYLDAFWETADVVVEGDDEVQQAVRFALFHVLQAGARAERRAIAAKGLTGPGYDGHAFWDTEMFVLPVLSYVHPDAASDALLWRYSTLDLARDRAQQLGLAGAAFAWRTIRGQECSAYWPAGTAAFHVNADVVDALVRYVHATGDDDFERDVATEVLIEVARLWMSLGHHDRRGAFRIQGVTGPDEYSALADDNVYTNLMAQRSLRAASVVAQRHREVATRLGVDDEEIATWETAADLVLVAWNDELGVHEQATGFSDLAPWDFAHHHDYPLLLSEPYGELYRRQVVKQADLVLALHWRGDAFTLEEKARAFAYYDPITVRDSSLSACTQAIVAAEVGHLELAHEYLAEAALMDLRNLAHNTKDGLHIASLAGTWLGLVAGFGGLRDHDGRLTFSPSLPHGITRLTFSLLWRGSRLTVTTEPARTTYVVADGDEPVTLGHAGREVTVTPGEPVTLPNRHVEPLTPVPTQPPGREPYRR